MAARKPSRLVESLRVIPDPRRPGGNLRHQLVDILVLALCGVLAGCQDFAEVVEFSRAKLDLFRQFLELRHGAPSEDTFERLFARLCPMALQAALVDWLKEVRRLRSAGEPDVEGPRLVAIDGKTLRRSFDTKAGVAALHLVSAWASEQGLTLGQTAVDAKSNEITAIPRLLELLELEGSVVTIDAAGCQKDIAAQIVEQGGDYLLAVKGNQPTLHEHVATFFERQCAGKRPEAGVRQAVTTETSHGRDERREVMAGSAPAEVTETWPGAQSVAMVFRESTEHSTGRTTGEVRYYVSSLAPRAKLFARVIRSHWGIENGLHWTLDVIFAEDRSRLRRNRAPENWAMLNRLALSLVKSERSTKGSLKCKRKRAGWKNDYLFLLLSSCP